tara:strand:+ start:467 stop:688 length:222 start_codon:yes stop_codon:yes gene_type:complete
MIEEEKRAVDFVVDEVYKDFKNTYGDLPKKKSQEIKPRKANQQIQIEQMLERYKNKEQVYQETLAKMLAIKED